MVCTTSRALALKVGSRLWEQIGLRGVATRNIDTQETERFAVDEILPYAPVSPVEAFEELRQAAGPDAWGEDPVTAIQEFRRGGDTA